MLKLQYFGHLMQRADSMEKTLMLGKIEGRRRRGWQRMRWLDRIINRNLSMVQKMVKDRKPGVLQFTGSQRVRHDWSTEQQQSIQMWVCYFCEQQRENTNLHLLCLEYRVAFQSDQGNLGAPCGMASGHHDLPEGQPRVVLLPPPRASQGKAAGICGWTCGSWGGAWVQEVAGVEWTVQGWIWTDSIWGGSVEWWNIVFHPNTHSGNNRTRGRLKSNHVTIQKQPGPGDCLTGVGACTLMHPYILGTRRSGGMGPRDLLRAGAWGPRLDWNLSVDSVIQRWGRVDSTSNRLSREAPAPVWWGMFYCTACGNQKGPVRVVDERRAAWHRGLEIHMESSVPGGTQAQIGWGRNLGQWRVQFWHLRR